MSYILHNAANLDDVWRYHEGSMSPSEAADFEKHLRLCAGCREDLAWARAMEAEAVDVVLGPPPFFALLGLVAALATLLLAFLLNHR